MSRRELTWLLGGPAWTRTRDLPIRSRALGWPRREYSREVARAHPLPAGLRMHVWPICRRLPTTAGPPTTRSYTGLGSYRLGVAPAKVGRVRVDLFATMTGSVPDPHYPAHALAQYDLKLVVSGSLCRHRRRGPRCLNLHGTLRGTAETEAEPYPFVSDQPTRVNILTLTGNVRSIGELEGGGSYGGTGFIHRGHRSIALVARARHRVLTINADGPPVGGFAAP